MTVFEYGNYRNFLKDYVQSLPKKGYGELSRIAERLRISPTLLSQILSGSRNLNSDQACELAEYLQLTELETDYFYFLVELEKAGTQKNKQYIRKRMGQLKEEALKLSKRIRHEKLLSDSERSVFYSSWLYPAVHLFLGLRSDGASLEEVSKKFGISRKKSSELTRFFLSTGLAHEKSGRYLPGVQSTFVEQGSPHLGRHVANWRVKAIQRLDQLTPEELLFTAPVSLSRKDFQIIREKLAKTIQEISEIVRESEPELLANINLDWFLIEG